VGIYQDGFYWEEAGGANFRAALDFFEQEIMMVTLALFEGTLHSGHELKPMALGMVCFVLLPLGC
jgi:hypothetical protein